MRAFVSSVGTWMQRTAQDWLVLTQLMTHHNASAIGTVMALQFGPQLMLLPWTGFAADHFDQRKLLMITQATMGALATALGVLTVAGVVQLWEVYGFAFLFGCASAFDGPVRQTFVGALVGDADLHNAVALSSTSFNAGRMFGPAVSDRHFRANFPIFISTMAVGVFHADARGHGLLTSILAIGTMSGALLAAGREKPRFSALVVGAAIFGLGCALAALAPGYWMFAGALVVIEVAALTFTNTSTSLMQISTEPAMRGRVMALRLGIALGGTPIGAPIVGWVANHYSPRWALVIGALLGFAAAVLGIIMLRRWTLDPRSERTSARHFNRRAELRFSGSLSPFQ